MVLNGTLENISTIHFVGLAAAIGLLVLVVDYGRLLLLRSKMPPGPFPLPLVGNVLQLPKCKPWYIFEEWANKYNSPIITVWFGREPTVILNDAWTASDLMDKRANIYSSRPVFQVPGRLMEGDKYNQTMLLYGDRWRWHRKLTVCLM
jgi:Cytochrome P450